MGKIDGEVVTRETEATIKVKVNITKVNVLVTMTTEEIMTGTGVVVEITEDIEAETDISHIEEMLCIHHRGQSIFYIWPFTEPPASYHGNQRNYDRDRSGG